MDIIELVSESVNLKKHGNDYVGLCPFHADKNPSLVVTPDKAVWFCHSCSIGGSPYDWVMKRDNVDFAEAKRRLDGETKQREIIATYDYTDAQGRLLFQVVRCQPKGFFQRRPDGADGWINDLKGVPRTLYRLPEVLSSDTVVIVEGEGDADRLASGGLCATTSPMGAGKWQPEYAQFLKGRRVLIIPDNDEEGRKHARQVAQSLNGIAKEIKLIKLPGLPPKGDVSDWLDSGGSVAELEQYIQAVEGDPQLTIEAGIYEFTWESFTARVSRVKEHRDGRTTGELRITTPDSTLLQSTLNLLSPRTHAELAKTLTDKCDTVNWQRILEFICTRTLEAFRQGEPTVELWTTTDIAPPRYLLDPIIAEKQPNFIYGPGGAGKSYLALLFGVCVQLPWTDNPFGLTVGREVANVLYLDWETTREEINWRLKCLKVGLNLPDIYINYRRCAMPLADDLESITETVTNLGCQFIIVDSLAAATGSDINAPEPALRFFRSLRTLNITSLIVAHVPKGGEKEIYGSVFFTNYGRSNWELKKEQEVGEREIVLGLFHRKANFSRLHEPLGFRLRFEDEATRVELADLKHSQLSTNLPHQEQIATLLAHGPMTVKEIAEGLDKPEATMRMALNRYTQRFTKVDDKWGLLTISF